MKKLLFFTISIFALSLSFPSFSFSQGMMSNMMGDDDVIVEGNDDHTAREEAEGKAIWEKLQAKELGCDGLTNENFEALGEYFMGQMAGSSHEAMNNMMTQMMSKEGEKQMHAVMGKRMSGCKSNAPIPQNMARGGMMPMMKMIMNSGMMRGGGNSMPVLSRVEGMGNMMGNFGTSPMGWFGFGWIFMILFWGLIILGIIALIKWLVNQSKSETKTKSALDILKERYAKGEIDKKEFEEKKKDLI